MAIGEGNMEGSNTLTVLQKLTLSAHLLPLESVSNFEQVYTMPILQTLGMPLYLITLAELVPGISNIILLPTLGWVLDKGNNTHRRKTVAIILSCSLHVLGFISIALGNALHLMQLTGHEKEVDLNATDNRSSWNTANKTGFADDNYPYRSLNAVTSAVNTSTGSITSDSTSSLLGDSNDENDSEVPLKAVIAMAGIIMIDIANNTGNCFWKSFALPCCARSDQRALLALGLIVGGLGGILTASLGIVDFPYLLGLSDIKGGSLSIQIGTHGLLLATFMMTGVTVTLVSGRRQLRRNQEYAQKLADSSETHSQNNQREETKTSTSQTTTLANGIHPFKSKGKDHTSSVDSSYMHESYSSEKTPLINSSNIANNKNDLLASQIVVYDVSASASKLLEQPADQNDNPLTKPADVAEYGTTTKVDDNGDDKNQRFKLKVAAIFFASYFAQGGIQMYTMTGSDYIGKVVYGGDPDADAGSDRLERYGEGVRMTTWGFLWSYTTYLLFNTVHNRVLTYLGYRVEFVVVQLLTGASMMILVLTAKLELYFVLTTMAAMQRACYNVVPYSAMNDVFYTMGTSSKESGKRVSFAISLVACACPLCLCTLFAITGPLEELSGSVSTPLWMGVGFNCLSAFIFPWIGKI